MRESDKLPFRFKTWEGEITKAGKKEPVVLGQWYEACKGCGICVEVCPKNVWELVPAKDKWNGETVEVTDPNKCIKCMLCEIHCPDFALKIK